MRSRQAVTSCVLAAGGGLAAYCLPSLASAWPPLRVPLGIRDRLVGGGVALTFDDGPSPKGTPFLLEVLRSLDLRATFFLVGEQVESNPALVGEILAQGHGIGLHGYRHGMQMFFTPRQVAEDMHRGAVVIESAAGFVPPLYRPPLGVMNVGHLRFARERGWQTWLWSADGRDWMSKATAESIAHRVLRRAGEGGVILLHDADRYGSIDSWRRVAAALPRIAEGLERGGLKIRPLVAQD